MVPACLLKWLLFFARISKNSKKPLSALVDYQSVRLWPIILNSQRMSTADNSLQMTPLHRLTMLTLIIIETVGFGWGMTLFINYITFRFPFLEYKSILTAKSTQTHYIKNVSLYVLFWLQHILMSTLKYKIAVFTKIRSYVLYERYIFNISSALTLWFIYSNVQPSHIQVFTIPSAISVPFALLGLLFLSLSMLELGYPILMPYHLRDILNQKYLAFHPYNAKAQPGLKTNGIYSYLRHPLQSGLLLLMIFGTGVFTTEKILHLAVMVTGIVIGVLMEEGRMDVQFKDYKAYRERVKARFLPGLHFIGL